MTTLQAIQHSGCYHTSSSHNMKFVDRHDDIAMLREGEDEAWYIKHTVKSTSR